MCWRRCSADYAGTVILISHDRDFLDRVVNVVLAPDGDGRWIEYAGGYSDMLAQRGADLAGQHAAAEGQGRAGAARAAPARRACAARQAQAQLQREARAGDAAEGDRRAAGAHALAAGTSSTIRPSTRAIPRRSPRPRRPWPKPHSRLAAAEERWLELEILREEIAGG